jgi:hypothetical protein
MLRMVARDSRRARTIAKRSPPTSVMPALSMATSVPVPIAGGECWCVVDSVPGHRDPRAICFQRGNDARLVLGTQVGAHLVQAAHRRGDGLCGDGIVTRQHDYAEATLRPRGLAGVSYQVDDHLLDLNAISPDFDASAIRRFMSDSKSAPTSKKRYTNWDTRAV